MKLSGLLGWYKDCDNIEEKSIIKEHLLTCARHVVRCPLGRMVMTLFSAAPTLHAHVIQEEAIIGIVE